MLILTILMASVTVMAQTAEPVIGIVNRTNCGIFWRLDFNYKTVDADGETPVVLSAAIFMTNSIYNKNQKAKGCGLINHYTITDDFANALPELFDSKEHDTDYINTAIYEKFGNGADSPLAIDKIANPAFFDEESEAMKDIIYHQWL